MMYDNKIYRERKHCPPVQEIESICRCHRLSENVVGTGDGGTLPELTDTAVSPLLMMSWIDASSASTRSDICVTVRERGVGSAIVLLHSRSGCLIVVRTALEDLGGHLVEIGLQLF
jgi:hypothetical protein